MDEEGGGSFTSGGGKPWSVGKDHRSSSFQSNSFQFMFSVPSWGNWHERSLCPLACVMHGPVQSLWGRGSQQNYVEVANLAWVLAELDWRAGRVEVKTTWRKIWRWVMWKRSCVVEKGNWQLENTPSTSTVCVPCHGRGCRQRVQGLSQQVIVKKTNTSFPPPSFIGKGVATC